MPINYGKGLVYKWVCNDLTVPDFYVGSTTNFNERKRLHKYGCTKEGNSKYHYALYVKMRETGGFENWCMILIENYACGSKKELEARERHFIEALKPSLNSRIPTRTRAELDVRIALAYVRKKKQHGL